MRTGVLCVLLSIFAGTGILAGDGSSSQLAEPIRYAVYVSGFGLSDAADDLESAVAWDEVDATKFAHIHVQASLPGSVRTLKAKYRKLQQDGTGEMRGEIDLVGKRLSPNSFDFTITHYVLTSNTTYLVRIADDFEKDTKCLASHSFKTKK
jgi:hypothetical protein